MARKPRIYFPGAVYHVMLRGNGGMKIFFHDEDREYFYFLINEGVQRYEYQIHSFCLMNNHVHFLMRVGNVSLSKIIQNISFRYTQWINRRENRVGHLFQGRYKAILVDDESYLLELVRYIHLNPIRANLVDKIDDYRWSSHHVYMGLKKLPWLSTDWVLSHFAIEKSSAISHYLGFIMNWDDDTSCKKFQTGNQPGRDILAGDNFMEKIGVMNYSGNQSRIGLDFLMKLVCDYYQISILDLKGDLRKRVYTRARTFVAILAQEFNQSTLTSVAACFNRDVTGIIRSIRLISNDHDATAVTARFNRDVTGIIR